MLPAFLRQSTRTRAIAETRTIDVAGRSLPLAIRPVRTATRMTLRIEPGGKGLKLTVPAGIATSEVDAFLVRHHGWLMTRLAKFPRRPELGEGRYIHIRGVAHRIERTGKLRGLTETIEIDGEQVIRLSGEAAHLGRRLRDHLKAEARRDLEALVARHAARLGRTVGSITLKDTKSRWGSCSQDGNLSFSWRIVMAPPHVIDYLAAHEVAHLAEMNHSPRFWAICGDLCARTEDAKHWLKRNGTMLHALDFT